MCLHHCGKHRLLFFSLRLSAWARRRSGDVRGGARTRLCSWRRERGGRSGRGLGRARGRAFRSFSRHSPTCFAAGLRRTTPCKLATEEAFPVSFHQAADPAPRPGERDPRAGRRLRVAARAGRVPRRRSGRCAAWRTA